MKWQIVPGAMVTPKEKQWLVDAAQKANNHDAVILARFLYHKMMQEDKMSILDKERAS